MLTTKPTFEDIERMNIAAAAKAASDFGQLEAGLTIPKADLELFFRNVPGKTMLDIGCGWGRYVNEFVVEGMDYIGIDHSPEMLAEARRRNPGQRFSELSYHELEECFGYEAFDGVWACCVLGGEPQVRVPDVLEQIRRVLVPDGIVLFVLPLSFDRKEHLAEDTDLGPMYFSSWDSHGFGQAVQDAGFKLAYALNRFEHGSMTFIGRKE